MAQKVSRDVVLAYDLGGTKVAAGVVRRDGKVLEEIRVPAQIDLGKEAVLTQLSGMGRELIKRYPKVLHVGLASAGPLDPERGDLLDPSNFKSAGKNWGRVPITRILSRRLHIPVQLENDAAAAILAECWVGAARRIKNAMVLTLGTGLGTGIVVDGALVRAGRFMHPEAGHLILNSDDKTAHCGCGNYGCAEAYLSGLNFSRRASAMLGQELLSGKEIASMARSGHPTALGAFEEYAHMMAVAIHNFVVIYCPEIVIFTGSFAHASDLFLKQTETELERLLIRRRVGVDLMPKLVVSRLKNQASLIGGARVAFNAIN